MNKNTVKNILFSFIPVIIVAGLGSIFVNIGMDWFNSLIKPQQWLSNFIIPIVWTIIYTLTGIVIFRWNATWSIPKTVKILFIINGILNVLWCLLFFTFNLTFIGLIAIIINLIFGFILLYKIKQYMAIYFYVLYIYPIWLSIATSLNLALWILN